MVPVPVPATFPVPSPVPAPVPVPDPDLFIIVFQQQKICTKSFLFSARSRIVPLASKFRFFDFITFYVRSSPKNKIVKETTVNLLSSHNRNNPLPMTLDFCLSMYEYVHCRTEEKFLNVFGTKV